jgi:hypothetical protein
MVFLFTKMRLGIHEPTDHLTCMLESSRISRLPSEFDAFLFAPIGVEATGMPLTVLSALARSDLDPWDEAERLAGVPEKYATARLARLIAALPGRPAMPAGYGTIATRLVALLPRRTTSDVALPRLRRGSGVAQHSWTIVCVVLMTLALGAQWMAASNQASAMGSRGDVPAAKMIRSAVPAPNDG